MILVALALQAAGPALGVIGPQQLPAQGCAAYLWRVADAGHAQGLAAMASADPAQLRVMLDGRTLDLARVAQRGEAGFGFATHADYGSAAATATLDLTAAPRAGLSDGALVPQATLTLARHGGDAIVVPLAGLIGCRPPATDRR